MTLPKWQKGEISMAQRRRPFIYEDRTKKDRSLLMYNFVKYGIIALPMAIALVFLTMTYINSERETKRFAAQFEAKQVRLEKDQAEWEARERNRVDIRALVTETVANSDILPMIDAINEASQLPQPAVSIETTAQPPKRRINAHHLHRAKPAAIPPTPLAPSAP